MSEAGSVGYGSLNARVAELVDAQDLKSCFPQRKYGFDSRPGHFKIKTVTKGRNYGGPFA
jgi:hypothetical protein